MNLPFQFDLPATLADGSVVMLPVHEARVLWNDLEQRVPVLATGNRPLVGTALLDGFELTIPFRDGSIVSLETLFR
jgi:predicted aspartyl protease